MILKPVDNPPNPWATTDVEYLEGETPDARLRVLEDHSRSILSKNDSPDVPFTWSVNPYRGCFHACAYCYARPSHEFLSLGAGTDFDRTIVVKPDAPALLRAAFDKPSWKGDVVVFSGVTDCYQPLEASYRLTRACLEVCLAYKNPVGIITKAPLVERDVDLLADLAKQARLSIAISIPFWDASKARAIEPYVATPQRRMRTVERLAAKGIRVGVNVAPLIPGLSDEDVPAILAAAKDAGASGAGTILLRLPGPVKAIFEARVTEAFPDRAERILNRVRDSRGGALNDPRFGHRMRGEGPYAEAVLRLFKLAGAKVGLPVSHVWMNETASTFERPAKSVSGASGSADDCPADTPEARPARPRQLPLF
ncbi:MAG: PA0069 family radical SAM protein [Polyangiaceae bacterium]